MGSRIQQVWGTDGKGSGYSSRFHGYRTEVWGVLNTVLMERDLGTAAGSTVWLQNRGLGRPEYCTDGKGSGYSSWFHGYRTEV
jgi:hypothetical protein